MSTVDEVRKALDAFEAVMNLPPTTYEMEEAKNELLAVVVPWLRDLLAEHDRLQRVADAARVLAVHIPAMLSGSAELENDERLALKALVAALAAAGE